MLLVRHGQSEFNAAFTLTRVDPGIPDPELTPVGRLQAEEAQRKIQDAAVIPEGTAKPAANNTPSDEGNK